MAKLSHSRTIAPASLPPASEVPPGDLYERDFAAWVGQQLELLRARRFDALDLAHLEEEIEDMGARLRHELRSRLEVLLVHLLKYAGQPSMRTGSWLGTIAEQRDRIADLLEDSPSLRTFFQALAAEDRPYRNALRRAVLETGLPASTFPDRLEWTADQILDPAFWPGPGPHPEP